MPSKFPPILVLGDHLGYPDGVAHGATTYFLNVLPGLKRQGFRFSVCFLREAHPAAATLLAAGIQPVFLAAGKWNPFVVAQVARLARSGGCRIFHAAGIKATLIGRIVARMVGAATIMHIHDLNQPSWPVRVLHRLFARPADFAVCVSTAITPLAVKGYHVRADRVRVIPSGIELARFAGLPAGLRTRQRELLGLPAGRKVIAMMARLFPVKGHREMIRMMPAIVAKQADVTLLIVGDGPERPACEAIVAALQLQQHVAFLGHRTDIPEMLAATDVLVIPSHSEGLPIAAIEAFACGRPVVAFNVGGIPDVVTHGVDGILVEPGDEVDFVNAVTELLRNDERREALGQNASIASTRFTLDAHLARLQQCYAEAIAT